jgi:hypothetical protein
MNTIEQDLQLLGTTVEEVANTLRSLGIKGHRYGSASCPIFRYLHDKQGHTEVAGVDTFTLNYGVRAVNISLEDNCDDSNMIISVPTIYQFIDAFDDGMYVDLIDRG